MKSKILRASVMFVAVLTSLGFLASPAMASTNPPGTYECDSTFASQYGPVQFTTKTYGGLWVEIRSGTLGRISGTVTVADIYGYRETKYFTNLAIGEEQGRSFGYNNTSFARTFYITVDMSTWRGTMPAYTVNRYSSTCAW